MKQLTVTFILFTICTANAFCTEIIATKEYLENHSLLKAIEGSNLIVVGEVIDIVYILRSIHPRNPPKSPTTDIVVEVHDALKGKPNHNESTVIFTIEGGEYIDTHTGEKIRLWVSGVPEFSIGDQLLIFLSNKPDRYYRNLPNDGYYLFHDSYGKIEVKEGHVMLSYYVGDYERDMESNISPFGNKPLSFDFRFIVMPIDLVVQLGLAFAVNKEATQALENTIIDIAQSKRRNTKVTLDPEIVKELTSKAEQIIKRGKSNN